MNVPVSVSDVVTPVSGIIFPLDFDSSNVAHVFFLVKTRDDLCKYLVDKKYSPKKETVQPSIFREQKLFSFAQDLLKKGLRDGNAQPVSLYDCCDFVTWLYHGYKWLNATLTHSLKKDDKIMNFSMKQVPNDDGTMSTVITYHPAKGDPEAVISKHTEVNWCSWAPTQMIGPLNLASLIDYKTSHKRNLYDFFTGKETLVSPSPSVTPVLPHLVDAAVTKSSKSSKGPKTKPKTPKAPVVNGGAGGPSE